MNVFLSVNCGPILKISTKSESCEGFPFCTGYLFFNGLLKKEEVFNSTVFLCVYVNKMTPRLCDPISISFLLEMDISVVVPIKKTTSKCGTN